MAKQTNNRSRSRSRGTQGKKDSNSKRVNFDNERESKFDKEEGFKKSKACNDIAWYTHNAELLKAAASIPSYYTNGAKLPFTNAESVPGVLACYWSPTLGCYDLQGANEPFAAANQAANSMYSYVVHANSRNKSYDATDLMTLVLAGAQLFSFIAYGIRVYGVMRYYDEQNLYLPKALVRAMGFDYNDLRDNLSDMWFGLNDAIARASQIWIPNTMPVLARWFWMNSNVYMDATTPKAQYYIFSPSQIYVYNETKYTTGGCLEAVSWGGSHTWAQYMQQLNTMFTALLDSQDRGIIFGDILKAYGEERIYKLSEIPADYMVAPIYDQEVLTQIENSTATGFTVGDIYTSTSFKLVTQPYVTTSAPTLNGGEWLPHNQVLNFHNQQDMTPEMVMIATRLKAANVWCVKDFPSVGDYSYRPYTSGTEYLSNYVVWYYDNSGTLQAAVFATMQQGAINVANLRRLMSFEWHPWLYLQSTAPTVPESVAMFNPDEAIGEYDNYTFIDGLVLDKLHTAAVFSEFGIPQM